MKKKNNSNNFREAVKKTKLPILTLDGKWHELFLRLGKTSEIVRREADVNELLKLQGKLINDIKAMKQLKKQLVNSIVANMNVSGSANPKLREKTLSKNKELIEEINVKIDNTEDELSMLPYKISEMNYELMLEGLQHCYNIFSNNVVEIDEMKEEIEELNARLYELMEKKAAMENNNSQMYTYLHDIVGHEIMERFDDIEKHKG